VAYKV